MKVFKIAVATCLLLVTSVSVFACVPIQATGAAPPKEMTEPDYFQAADMVITGRVTALEMKSRDEWQRQFHAGEYRIIFRVDTWQKGSGPEIVELFDGARMQTDCDYGRPPPESVATYYMNYDPAGKAEDFDFSWKVYAERRNGKLQVIYSVPWQEIKRTLRAGPDWETVQLERTETVEGAPLPAGTELTIRYKPGTHAISHAKAILHQRAPFMGLALEAGTTLLFSEPEQADRIARSGVDPKKAVIYTDIIAPSAWNIGSLRVNGRVRVGQRGDALVVECGGQFGKSTPCYQGSYPVLHAEFGPGLKPRLTTVGSRSGADGEPFRIRVGSDVLEAYGNIEYWPDGSVRALTLTGRQTFRGKEAAGTLRFWANGNPQEIDRERYCRNGQDPKPLQSAIRTGVACDDGSLLYIETRLMCLQPELARQKFDFLRKRPPGMLDECAGGTSYSIGGPSYLLVVRDPE